MKTNSADKMTEIASRNELSIIITPDMCVTGDGEEMLESNKKRFKLEKSTFDSPDCFIMNVTFTNFVSCAVEDDWLDNISGVACMRFVVDREEPCDSNVLVSDAFGYFGEYGWTLRGVALELGVDLEVYNAESVEQFIKELSPVDFMYITYAIYKDSWKNEEVDK